MNSETESLRRIQSPQALGTFTAAVSPPPPPALCNRVITAPNVRRRMQGEETADTGGHAGGSDKSKCRDFPGCDYL